jgi:hypothetical protein
LTYIEPGISVSDASLLNHLVKANRTVRMSILALAENVKGYCQQPNFINDLILAKFTIGINSIEPVAKM